MLHHASAPVDSQQMLTAAQIHRPGRLPAATNAFVRQPVRVPKSRAKCPHRHLPRRRRPCATERRNGERGPHHRVRDRTRDGRGPCATVAQRDGIRARRGGGRRRGLPKRRRVRRRQRLGQHHQAQPSPSVSPACSTTRKGAAPIASSHSWRLHRGGPTMAAC